MILKHDFVSDPESAIYTRGKKLKKELIRY